MSGQTRESMPIYLKDKIKVKLLHPKASYPKMEDDDVRYSVSLQTRTDNRAEDDSHAVNLFGTGLTIMPPPKHYFQMVASPTLYKHGYSLAPGCHIIPSNTTGELVVPLFKFNEDEDIELPFDAVQLILCPVIYAHVAKVTERQMPQVFSQDYMQQPMQGYYAPMQPSQQPRGSNKRGGGSRGGGGSHMF
jgi:hypothetical protein